MAGGWCLLGVLFFIICKVQYKEKFGTLVEIVSDEDAAALQASDEELDLRLDVAIEAAIEGAIAAVLHEREASML